VWCIWREREREREHENMKCLSLVVQLCSFSCSFLSTKHLALHTPPSLCKPLGTKSPKSGHPSKVADMKVSVTIMYKKNNYDNHGFYITYVI
jgi:hypothetical protein